MIVSRRNDTKPLVKISGFVSKMIMYIFNDYKNLDLFVLSMTNVLNSRPTEMVISLKESFSKEFIIIGLPSHLLMLPVSLLFFQILFGMRNSFSIRIINPTLMAISSSPLESIFSSLKINARFYQLIEKQTRFEYELVFIGYISAILLCRLAFLNLILTLNKKEKTATCRQYIISI